MPKLKNDFRNKLSNNDIDYGLLPRSITHKTKVYVKEYIYGYPLVYVMGGDQK